MRTLKAGGIWAWGRGLGRVGGRRCASFAGLCYQFYPYRFYQFGPDDSVIRLIGFVPIKYQRGSQGQPLKPVRALFSQKVSKNVERRALPAKENEDDDMGGERTVPSHA